MNEAIELLQENVECSALDALIETFENLLDNGRVHVEDGAPDEATVAKLKDLYQKIDLASLSKEERRSVLQLCLLQAYKREKVQANHQMTPDTIGFFIGISDRKSWKIYSWPKTIRFDGWDREFVIGDLEHLKEKWVERA